MKSGMLYLFNTQEEINPLLGLGFTKERFRNGDFINESWVTIAQRQDISDKCDVLFNMLKPQLIEKYTMEEFHKLHLYHYTEVRILNDKHQLNLSWLEMLQVAAVCRFKNISEESNLLEVSQELLKFYNKVIKNYDF